MQTSTIDLASRHFQMVLKILQDHAPQLEAFAFGSRVTGTAKRFSDLDIALIHPGGGRIPLAQIWTLRDAFSESDLPINVDIIDFRAADPAFQNIIQRHWVKIEKCDGPTKEDK